MESVREGYATAPTDICIPTIPEQLNSSNSSHSLDDTTEEAQAIPSGLIKYKWQLVLGDVSIYLIHTFYSFMLN